MISKVTIQQIDERLQELPPEKLGVVYDFVSYLAEKKVKQRGLEIDSEALQTMLASEALLRQEWDRPEEDKAWANL